MKKDIDLLMQTQGIDALIITGNAFHNPSMVYFTGFRHVSHACLIRKRNKEGLLFHYAMERDEATATGLKTRSFSLYPAEELRKAAGNNPIEAEAIRYERMLTELSLASGRVVLYGLTDLGAGVAVMQALQRRLPGLEIVSLPDKDILLEAMQTKGEDEVEHIRFVGKVTVEVVGKVADMLTSRPVRDGVLLRPDGEPLTIGEIKRSINLWLAEGGVENPEGTIFSIGRDSGVPHSSGNASDVLRLGETIIFDIFPCEEGGGYFHDFTRTWCLGYATDEALKLYADVREIYEKMMTGLKAGTPFKKYQKMTCEFFEERGHPTVLSSPQTEEGYVHSLGHGVGLHIHEQPFASPTAAGENLLLPGSVVAIEPGLYYPERGLGMRIENTVWITPQGDCQLLAEYPVDLVLPVKQG